MSKRERPFGPDRLETVRVPAGIEATFLRAQQNVAEYFRDQLEDPTRGTIERSGERYVLVRASSLSAEFFDLIASLYADRGDEEAANVARNLLFDLSHSIGKADACAFHGRMGLEDPIDRLAAGPIHFAFSGWAFVDILPESKPTPSDEYVLVYDHPFSFESDSWMRQGRTADFPVCIMSAGYSSGWCEESFGLPLVAVEIECRARGDQRCRFVMAPPGRIGEHIEAYLRRNADGSTPHRERAGPHLQVPEYFQRKRLEDELRAAKETLERRVEERTAELAAANEQLRNEIRERQKEAERRAQIEVQMQRAQKLESLGVLAGGIAHDFNNLLVGVLGNASLLLQQIPGGSVLGDPLRAIRDAADCASKLTDQLLAYAGESRSKLEPTSLNTVLRRVGGFVGRVLSTGAALEFDLAGDLPSIEADSGQLQQVVLNLVINASEALPDHGGTIALRTGTVRLDSSAIESMVVGEGLAPGRYVSLEVSDTGHGMDQATLARILDPFFTTKFAGRGLGLAAVSGIVRAHGGAISIHSQPGVGSTFSLFFPAGGAAGDDEDVTDTVLGEELRGAGRALIIDDEPIVREVAEAMLRRLGFAVLTARDGREGLELLREHDNDVAAILLDVTMPAMSGYETLRRIREQDCSVAVFLMSGHATASVAAKFSDLTYSGMVHKPFDFEALVQALRPVLKGPA